MSTSTSSSVATVAVVGAGLVGTLNAIYFAQRGWNVLLFESRPDMRLPERKNAQRGRSINLALSERGLSALRATHLDLDQIILNAAVPMRARMVHIGHQQLSQAYSPHGEHINAVDRARLNELLLDAAEQLPNVTLFFEYQFVHANIIDGHMIFVNNSQEHIYEADLIVGADGAYSKVRSQMMRATRMNYEQVYIDTAYCELSMPPIQGKDGEPSFALDPNHLHIWPRHTFMLIALPNPDRSFTCTLFMPFDMFDAIDTEEKLLAFFNEHFKDAVPLIGRDRLIQDYFAHPRGSLITVKASPHHVDGKAVMIGDAAHAMVPFYGQGMNCGFQDVEVLHSILDRYGVTPLLRNDEQGNTHVPGLKEALEAYSEEHVKDTHTICELALYNYYEMRSAVTSLRYMARKKVESLIHIAFPHLIIPLYTMVSFSTYPYSQALQRWKRQNYWLHVSAVAAATATVAIVGIYSQRHLRHLGHLAWQQLLSSSQVVKNTMMSIKA